MNSESRAKTLTMRTVPVAQLRPAPYNPRVALRPGMPGYERLRRSLNEFDLVQPIVWNERTGHVVSGHQRLAILIADGVTELDVAVVDLPLEREQALNLTLNNARVGGDWDNARLLDLLDELRELPDFDATLTGFSHEELQTLLLAPAPADATLSADDLERDRCYRVSFEIATEDWERFEPPFNTFLADHDLKPHIRPPKAER